jgi:competence protein ComEC
MSRYFQRSTITQWLFIGILSGLLVARFGVRLTPVVSLLGIALLPFLVRMKIAALVAIMFIGLLLGVWRGGMVHDALLQYECLQNQTVTLVGRVMDDAAYGNRGQLEFQISDVSHKDEALPGKVRIRGYTVPQVERGDVIEVTGKLREGYGSRQGSMSYAQIEVLGRDTSWLEETRSRFFAAVYSTISEPQASLGLGFLVGTRTLLPDNLTEQLSITGLTHIVAVSGYNLTILVRVVRRLFSGRSAFLALAGSLGLIGGFILVTGMSPSIARATAVSTLALLAWYYGRRVKPTMLILFAAALTAFINPLYLWFDLGWYLSFAAFFGVLIVAPLISKRLFRKPPKLLGQIILETSSAQLMTLPIIAVIFGELSAISLLANIIILPLIPLAMLLTFVAGVAGMVMPLYAGWVAWPAVQVMRFMTETIELLSQRSWALIELDMTWLQLGVIYSFVVAVVVIAIRKNRISLNGSEVIE